jgi:hypothetical protein
VALATPVSAPSGSRRTTAPAEPAAVPVIIGDDGQVAANVNALRYHSFAYFMSEVHDDQDHPMLVEPHTEEWCDLFQYEPFLDLMAPRDHGKSVCARCYMLWRAWRHNRNPETGLLLEGNPEGRFECVVFSETVDQATEWFEIAQSLMLGNPELFGDLTPDLRRAKSQLADVWSKRRMRLRNGFEAKIRSWRTSTRGLHPDLLILDDVLSDQNTLTAYQRNKSWTYFVGTLMPMNASEIKIIGTALHYDDLLHRLKPDPKKAPLVIQNRPVRVRWLKYRSVDWDTGQVLWERRHNLADLQGKRDFDAQLFSREYQNDPRDDASSLFPFPLTQVALDAGKGMTFETSYRKQANEFVLLGYDLAASEEIGADYCVVWVAVYNHATQQLRVIYGHREQGMTFADQLNLLRRCCLNYGVDIGVIEENGFQKWLYAETQKYPETAGRLIGHRTGREKTNLAEGVPAMKLSLLQHQWTFPCGDEPSLRLARIWQSEMSAFGWKDDKLAGVGEHDDCVLAFWFVDRAKRQLQEWLATKPAETTVSGEELGIERVTISGDY